MRQPVRQKPTEVYYPESDGKPVESETHGDLRVEIKQKLQWRYRDAADVHVGMDLGFYFVEGDPTRCVAPDVFVSFGMDKAFRRVYKTWVEGKLPEIVFELTSKSTRREDTHDKVALYAQLGIEEYVLVDPLGEYLRPPLQAYRLGPAGYERLPGPPVVSAVLGLRMSWEAGHLVMVDIETGEELLAPMDAAQREAERAQREAELRSAAENRVRELEAQLAQLRRGTS